MSLPASNRPSRLLVIFIMFLIAILLISCSIQRAGSTQDAPDGSDGSGGEGDGAGDDGSDSLDLEESGDEAFDEIDLTSFPCPDEPRTFILHVNSTLFAKDEDGAYYTQHNDENTGSSAAQLLISKNGVVQPYPEFDSVFVIIEGKSGDCDISGKGEFSIKVSGTCKGSIASLNVVGEWKSWSQTIQCPGKAPITASEGAFPAPSIEGDFWLTESGHTIGEPLEFPDLKIDYSWKLIPEQESPIPMD